MSADALGTTPYFLADSGESIGVHPVLRLRPPVGAFRGLAPAAIAVGHGPPVITDAERALVHAVDTARSGTAQGLVASGPLRGRGPPVTGSGS